VQKRPAIGVQFVDIPEFADLGDKVSAYVDDVLTGASSVKAALDKGQKDAEKVGALYRKQVKLRPGGAGYGGTTRRLTDRSLIVRRHDDRNDRRVRPDVAPPRRASPGDSFRARMTRRLPLLPALTFTVVVTQLPFLYTIYISLVGWDRDHPELGKSSSG